MALALNTWRVSKALSAYSPHCGAPRRPAGNILRRNGVAVAASIGIVVDLVGPCVIGRCQQTVRESTLQRDHQRIILTVADGASPRDLGEGGVRTQPGERVFDVHIGLCEQMGAFAPHIGEPSARKLAGQRLLNGKPPLRHIGSLCDLAVPRWVNLCRSRRLDRRLASTTMGKLRPGQFFGVSA